MKTLKNTKSLSVTSDPEFKCEFCSKVFARERTIIAHMCESKRRWKDKDLPGNRIGFQVFVQFYNQNTVSRKQRTYLDFIKSAYYGAFVKFGNYCVEVKCISVNRYSDWLLKNEVKLDTWTLDSVYNRFLVSHLREEDPMDALARSIETTISLSSDAGVKSSDCLRYVNTNRVLMNVTNGKISPWMLYQCVSGIEFLEKLDSSQQKLILDYINPELWAIKFKRHPDSVSDVKSLLLAAGY